MNADQKQAALAMNAEQRAAFFHKQIADTETVWTIVDDDGVMILVSDDEDCIPVWPDASFVDEWINGDWAHCKAHSISLKDWQQKWLPGLEEDEVEVLIFPLPDQEGVVVSPWEFSN